MHPSIFLIGIEPFPIETSHNAIFLQLNDTYHIANYMPAWLGGFLDSPLASLTRYFEGGGANKDMMGRNENEIVFF